MLNRKFSTREVILLCVAAVLALGIFYYEVVYKNVMDSIDHYDTTAIQEELTYAQAKATNEKKMKQAIEEADGKTNTATIAVYNNLANEVNELGNILNAAAEEVSISWSAPTLTDTTVRRQASISFKTANYENARNLIQAISNIRYRNVISDLNVANQDSSTVQTTTVSLTLTFFETSTGATSLEGLTIMDSGTESVNPAE